MARENNNFIIITKGVENLIKGKKIKLEHNLKHNNKRKPNIKQQKNQRKRKFKNLSKMLLKIGW